MQDISINYQKRDLKHDDMFAVIAVWVWRGKPDKKMYCTQMNITNCLQAKNKCEARAKRAPIIMEIIRKICS